MSDSFLDNLPSGVRERIQRRLRSPIEYAALREKVKGPEDLADEMNKNEHLAEFKFALETEPELQKALRSQVERDIAELGMEQMIDTTAASSETKQLIERGQFLLAVSSHPTTQQDQLVVVLEGNVQEKIPLKPMASERYLSQLLKEV